MARRYQLFTLLGVDFLVPRAERVHLQPCRVGGARRPVAGPPYDKNPPLRMWICRTATNLTAIGNGFKPGTALPAGCRISAPGSAGVGLSKICPTTGALPEVYVIWLRAGAESGMIPAAFTAFTGKDHWQVLLQARAT